MEAARCTDDYPHLMNKDRSGSGFCQGGSSSRENIQTNLSTEITTLVNRSVNTCFYHHATIIPTVKDTRINVQEPHMKMKHIRLKNRNVVRRHGRKGWRGDGDVQGVVKSCQTSSRHCLAADATVAVGKAISSRAVLAQMYWRFLILILEHGWRHEKIFS